MTAEVRLTDRRTMLLTPRCYWLQLRTLLLVLVLIRNCVALDELMSARCQSRCLKEFEKSVRKENDALLKRRLKHAIVSLCKENGNCSSCFTPCQEPFADLEACKQKSCNGSISTDHCKESCEFMSAIYQKKPGSCAAPKLNENTVECVVSCRVDADCPYTRKCCSNGCGRSCLPAGSMPKNLLPRPESVSVSERKRGRSAVVRWVMRRMRRGHTDTHANLYVVQWKWGVRRQQARDSHWQTVSVNHKPYAILKHLLSPGRYYAFRVAAINGHGTRGYSEESEYFKLKKVPKAPSRPRNLDITGNPVLSPKGLLEQQIKWSTPTSDLPIVNYQISWSEATLEDTDDNSTSTTTSLLNDMPDRESGNSERAAGSNYKAKHRQNDGYWSEVVESTRNSARLLHLKPNTNYVVEVHAIAESETDEMNGPKATILFKTPTSIKQASSTATPLVVSSTLAVSAYTNAVTSTTTAASTTTLLVGTESEFIVNARVEKPYFHNGLLKADLVWDLNRELVDPDVDYLFDLSWRPVFCPTAVSTHGGGGVALSKPLKALSRILRYELYDLQFGCRYSASISALIVSARGRRGHGSASVRFDTPSCQNTQIRGSVKPDCLGMAPPTGITVAPVKFFSTPTNLNCKVHFELPQPASSSKPESKLTAKCTWDPPLNGGTLPTSLTVIGYRVVSGIRKGTYGRLDMSAEAPEVDLSTAKIQVVRASKRSLSVDELQANREYVFQVQAISAIGEGPVIWHAFVTPSRHVEKPEAESVYRTGDSRNFVGGIKTISSVDPTPGSPPVDFTFHNRPSSSASAVTMWNRLSLLLFYFAFYSILLFNIS